MSKELAALIARTRGSIGSPAAPAAHTQGPPPGEECPCCHTQGGICENAPVYRTQAPFHGPRIPLSRGVRTPSYRTVMGPR